MQKRSDDFKTYLKFPLKKNHQFIMIAREVNIIPCVSSDYWILDDFLGIFWSGGYAQKNP